MLPARYVANPLPTQMRRDSTSAKRCAMPTQEPLQRLEKMSMIPTIPMILAMEQIQQSLARLNSFCLHTSLFVENTMASRMHAWTILRGQ